MLLGVLERVDRCAREEGRAGVGGRVRGGGEPGVQVGHQVDRVEESGETVE